jgi:hypothetical protein
MGYNGAIFKYNSVIVLWMGGTKEFTLMVTLASLWIAAEVTLGPVIGRVSLGPLSMHGAIQHVVGWLLMVVVAELTNRFGRVTFMTAIAAVGTRAIRISLIEGMLVGLGYVIAGFLFDLLYFILSLKSVQKNRLPILLITVPTSIITLLPYLAFRYYLLGPIAFLVLLPSYIFSMAKNVVFSIFGVLLALSILPRVEEVYLKRG